MKKQLVVFITIAIVGILGLTLVPVSAVPSMSITSNGKLLSVSSNVALAVSTTDTSTGEVPTKPYTYVEPGSSAYFTSQSGNGTCFPQVAATNGGYDDGGTSHTVNLPSGIVAGN